MWYALSVRDTGILGFMMNRDSGILSKSRVQVLVERSRVRGKVELGGYWCSSVAISGYEGYLVYWCLPPDGRGFSPLCLYASYNSMFLWRKDMTAKSSPRGLGGECEYGG